MPLRFNDDEMRLPLELAQPIELHQRDQFLREVTPVLEAACERTGTGPGSGSVHRIGGPIRRRFQCSTQLGEGE
jgi:hypothetical protein